MSLEKRGTDVAVNAGDDASSISSETAAGWVQRVMALLALVIAALPALVTLCLIWFSLGRPLLFRQTRIGRAGRPFALVKFRTMHDLRDSRGDLLPDRERETRVTRFVRLLRLDEIPQLLAIVRGDMNFIGPRPLRPPTIAGFGQLGVARSRVRPGLTGWAQVNGNTRLSDFDKLALDIWYIENRSAVLNLWILLLTIATLLRGERVRAQALAIARARFDMHSPELAHSTTAGDGS